jgi:thioredoxin 1
MAGAATFEFTDANFDAEAMKASMPVLVDFWAEWCMPCRALAPTIDDLAKTYQGKVRVGKVDTDKNQATAMKFQITAIPTVVLLQNGQIVKKWVGNVRKDEFTKAIDSLVGAAS